MAVRVTTVVSAAASTYDLVTLAIVKDELNVTGTGDDAKLRRYIASASLAISSYCNRVFAQETVVDTFDLARARLQYFGEASLQATRWPVISVSSVIQADTTLEAGTDFRVDSDAALLYRLNASGLDTSWLSSPVVVTYDGGFATIPADLQDAAIRLVRGRWFAKDRDPLARSVSIPGVQDIQYWVPTGSDAGNMPSDVVDLIDGYRVPLVG